MDACYFMQWLMSWLLCRSARYRAHTGARSKVNMMVGTPMLQGPQSVWSLSGMYQYVSMFGCCVVSPHVYALLLR